MFDFKTIVTLLVFAFIVIACTGKKISMAMAGLISLIVLILCRVLTFEEAFLGFSDANSILVVSMYVISAALQKTHMTQKLSGVIKRGKGSTRKIILVTAIVNILAHQLVNGLAVVAMLLPMEVALTQDDELDITLPQLLLPTFICGQVAMGWLPMPKAVQKVAQYNAFLTRLGFTEHIELWKYCVIQIPMIVFTLLITVFLSYRFMPKKSTINKAAMEAVNGSAAKENGKLLTGTKEKVCYLICLLTIVGMVAGDIANLDISLISLIGAVMLILSGCMSGKEAVNSISWAAVIMFASFLPLGTAVANTNVAAIAGSALRAVFGGITNKRLLMMAIWLFPAGLTQFVSDAVTSASLTPLVVSTSGAFGLNPCAVMILMDFACNKVMLLPTDSASTLMVYSVGGYRPKDVLILGIIPAVLVCLTVGLWLPLFYF